VKALTYFSCIAIRFRTLAILTGLASFSGPAVSADPTPSASIQAAGMTWPAEKVFPRFAPVSALDLIDVSGLSYDRKVLFTGLQGLINRTAPRVYILDAQQSGEGKNFWIDKQTVPKTRIADPFTVLAKYQDEIKGMCIYDPAIMATVNLAVTSAGLNGCVVASPALAAILSAAPYGIRTLSDFRSNAFADDRAAYRWAIANLWPKCTHRMVAGLKPGVHYPLLDYVVANQAMSVWLSADDSADKALLEPIFSGMPINSVYLGWWPGETSGVGYASGYGIITFASDWFSNATVHGSESGSLSTLPALAAPPPLQNKCYIALILSDGDNLQEQEHLFPRLWNDTNRGTFPISWTQSPGLADFAPGILEHYYASATPNDCFITGPSGVGYVYPENWKPADFTKFAKLTESYLARTGIRTATIWGGTDWASNLYGENCPSLLGLATFGGPVGVNLWKKDLASMDMLPTYASSASQVLEGADGLTARMAAWTRKQPMFAAPQVNANVAGLPELHKVYDALKDDPDVVFVRADQLFQLIRTANGVTGVIPKSSPARGPFILSSRKREAGYEISYSLSEAGPLDYRVSDFSGRVVAQSGLFHSRAGNYTLLWDGKNASGEPVGAGEYVIRVKAGAAIGSGRLDIAR